MKHNTSSLAGLAMLIALTIFSIPAAATRYYVKVGGGADNNSGTGSWTTAYKTLQKALENASAGDEIWVAKGTYYPSVAADGISTDPRDKSFVLIKDVEIYGGFKGNDDEETIVLRDWAANKTILSGDIGTIDDNTDNVYHVVISINCTDAALLDGLTISGGNADDGGYITVNTKTVVRYYGGGMYNTYSSPTLTNVTISGNSANNGGGGMCNSSSSPTLTNVTISGNKTNKEGGGMYNMSSSPTLINVTISGNTATISGGGMYNYASSSKPNMKNSIIWGNNSGVENESAAAPVYTYSLVQGQSSTSNGNLNGTNAANNPQFVDSAGGDYRLKWSSPAIDAGNNADNTTTKDLAGNPRCFGTIDMGAYEYAILPTNGIIYVDSAVTANSNYTGSSWKNAIANLDEALAYTKTHTPGKDSIFVAKGTYYPSVIAGTGASLTDRDKAFVLVENVKIYGGFKGNDDEETVVLRDWAANKTILSGDLNKSNTKDNSDAYHVVISADAVGTALLDGLTISGGNADGSGSIAVNDRTIFKYHGGGMYNSSYSSPTLTNVTISGNSANTNGGGMYNSSYSSPTLTNVTISGNSAVAGGGMYNSFSSSSLMLTNVTISGNSAASGGGMYNASSSSLMLTNVTISGNSATSGGGMYNSSTPNIKNSIIWGNNSGVYNSIYVPEYTYSLVQDLNPTGTGNLNGTNAANNPQFVNPLSPDLSTGGDYRLQWRSPAIDVGNNADNTTTKDLAGNPRRFGTIDMGAYEYTLLPTNGIIYVDSAVAASSNYTGSSWENAITSLDEALLFTKQKTATGGAADSIFVAKGTYYPSVIAGTGSNLTDRDQAFVLVKDVKIYGGFAGTEATIDQRTPGNTTILSGNNNNAYHVVISADSVGAALLDGLTISGGNADGGSSNITVNGDSIFRNYGGGMYNRSSSPTLTNVTISGNKANSDGGGMYNYFSSPTLTNVTISGNTTYGSGGGMYSSSSLPTLTNVTISGNTAIYGSGGGMYNDASSPTLTNATISGNTAINGGGVYNKSFSTPTIQNSIIWGNNSGVSNNISVPEYKYSLVQGEHLTDNGNLDSTINPQFVDSAGGDYRLKWSSPAVDKGSKTLNNTTKDLAGNPRLRHNYIDLGAYENQDNYYIVVLPDEELTGISSINITADENNYLQFLPGKYRVFPGNNFTFTLTYTDGYDENIVTVKNNGNDLSPNNGTYTVNTDALVTINGVGNSDTEDGNGDGDDNGDDNGNGYDGIGLVITDGTTTIIEHIFINNTEVPFDTTAEINYIVDCGTGGPLNFLLTTKASGPALVTIPGDTAFDFTPKPGLNRIPVNIFAIDGTVSRRYDFVIEKRFEYDSLIDQKWNNTLLVRRNPNNNGGYTFVKYEWFCNNTSIGTEGFYSAGNKRTDLLDFDASYHAEMRTADGQKWQTCPGKPVKTAVAAGLRVYPNPVRKGNITHIQSGSKVEQLLNLAEPTEVSIYNSMGKFVKVQKLTAPLTEFTLDVAPGIYFIHLGEQQVKVVVD